MKRLSSVLMFMVIGVLAASSAQAAWTISGYVKDQNGVGIYNATVSANAGGGPRSSKTDATGHYVIVTQTDAELQFMQSTQGTLKGYIVTFQVTPSYTQNAFSPASVPVCNAVAGQLPQCMENQIANFTDTLKMHKSGDICYEYKCNQMVIWPTCDLCPNGSTKTQPSIYCSSLKENLPFTTETCK
jgi:hypothetical protein